MTSAPSAPERIPPALRAAIAADRIDCPIDAALLKPAQAALLRRLLTGEIAAPFEISLKRAFRLLARSDPSPGTGEFLGKKLADRALPRRDRHAAAAALALLPAAAAEAPLIRALPKAEGALRIELVRALGQLGTAKALTALSKLDPDEETPALQSQLRLANLAIASRGGPKARIELARDFGIEWHTAEAKKVEPAAIRAATSELGPAYGITIDPKAAFAFECGGTPHLALLNEKLDLGGSQRHLLRETLIAAVIVARVEGLDRYTIRWILATSPAGDGIHLLLLRQDGTLMLEGSGAIEGEGIRFALRDTGLDRTPTEVSGRVAGKDISWSIRSWRGPVRPKQRPRAVSDPAPLVAAPTGAGPA